MSKGRILIADDSEKLLAALRLQLEHYGYEVTACTDAYNALAQAQKQKPDVILLDIRMPAGDGFSVVERMQKLPGLKDTPVIYITGDTSPDLDFKAEQMGASGIIHKPLSLSALLKSIETALNGRCVPAGAIDPATAVYDVTADFEGPNNLREPI